MVAINVGNVQHDTFSNQRGKNQLVENAKFTNIFDFFRNIF